MPALRRPHCGPRRRTLLHTPPYGRHTSARQERSWKIEAKKNCLGNCSRGPKPLCPSSWQLVRGVPCRRGCTNSFATCPHDEATWPSRHLVGAARTACSLPFPAWPLPGISCSLAVTVLHCPSLHCTALPTHATAGTGGRATSGRAMVAQRAGTRGRTGARTGRTEGLPQRGGAGRARACSQPPEWRRSRVRQRARTRGAESCCPRPCPLLVPLVVLKLDALRRYVWSPVAGQPCWRCTTRC